MKQEDSEIYLLRVNLRQDPKLWASVLVPDEYSLLQLHILILDIFAWKESPYTTHAFHQTSTDLCPYDDSKVCISPFITYQTISSEECEGWLVEIGPGVCVEHSNLHDPSPTFNLGTDELEPLALRQLRDERIYTLKAAFQCSSQLEYEFDPIEEMNTFSVSIEILARSPLPSRTKLTGLKHTPIAVACNLTTFNNLQLMKQSFTKLNLLDMKQVQDRIDQTHISSEPKCYICKFYSFDCWSSSHWPSCSLYNHRSIPPCCDMCPGNNATLHFSPLPESAVASAWKSATNYLILTRQQFLEKPTQNNPNSPTKC